MNRADFNSKKCQTLMNTCEIFHVTREPIQSLDNDRIKTVRSRTLYKFEQAVPSKNRSARPSSILIDAKDIQALVGCIVSTEGDLILDGTFILQVR